jgi:two-component system invasion response regulator UvrY
MRLPIVRQPDNEVYMEGNGARIILVDDHVVVRNGLAELISIIGDYRIIGQYGHGQELLDAMPFPVGAAPDLILMDLTMPVLNGEQTVTELQRRGCMIPIIILTLNTDEATILRLYKLGIRAYLSKECSAAELQDTIGDVLTKGFHQSAMLQKALIASLHPSARQVDVRDAVLKRMTPRELEFLRLVCNEQEFTYEQMATKMGVSRRTVDGYRESLFEKFDIRSKTGLVLFATRHRLTGAEPEADAVAG